MSILIEVREVRYLKEKTEVSFEVKRGSRIRLTGPSGSGKSTLLKILLGVAPPLGGSLSRNSFRAGYVPQELPPLYVKKLNDFIEEITSYDVTKHERSLFKKNLLHELDRLELPESLLDASPETLSGGEKQRFMVAVALARSPEVFFLDEPTSALPPEMKEKIRDIFCESSASIVFSSHDSAWENCKAEEVNLAI